MRLCDDVLDVSDDPILRQDPRQDQEQLACEINSSYVAATRALKRLLINPNLAAALSSDSLGARNGFAAMIIAAPNIESGPQIPAIHHCHHLFWR